MKGQYLSIDAVIASIIFILLAVSVFTFLRFSLFSEQYYEKDIDQSILYVSGLMFSPDSTYSIIDISYPGKRIYSDTNTIRSKLTSLSDSIPHFLYVVISGCSSSLHYPYYLPSGTKLVSHVERVFLNTNDELCKVDIYLGTSE